jgi:hypothetical protein
LSQEFVNFSYNVYMVVSGEMFRRLRLYLGLESRSVAQDICSESYLSLLETGKRSFEGEIALLLLSRLNVLRESITIDSGSISEFSLELDLIRSLANSNENKRALAVGNQILERIYRSQKTLEVDSARVLGTISNSLLMLNRSDEALAMLTLQGRYISDEATLYHEWAWANYYEFVGNSRAARERFQSATDLALISGQKSLSAQLRQGAVHSSLESGNEVTSEEMSFLESERNSAFNEANWTNYCLLSGTLSLALERSAQLSNAEFVLHQGLGKVSEVDNRVACTVYLVALDVLSRLGNSEVALKVLTKAMSRLANTESTAATAKMWGSLSLRATSLNEFEKANACKRRGEKIFSQLAA